MNRKEFKEFITRRSTVWTLSLCMTGILVLGGITAANKTRDTKEMRQETELDEYAFLDEEAAELNDTLDGPLAGERTEPDDTAEVSGNQVTDENGILEAGGINMTDGVNTAVGVNMTDGVTGAFSDGTLSDNAAVPSGDGTGMADTMAGEILDGVAPTSSTGVISEQLLISEGIDFSEEEYLLWPSAGTILIDYSMDGSVYFPTLDQYKYNPALIIGTAAGNQVLAAAKGIVETVYIDEETGTTLIMNIGNGYKLTYGQLCELAVEEGDIVDEGTVIGYVSQPTKYYSTEGSNLYFAMTQNEEAVDPVIFLE